MCALMKAQHLTEAGHRDISGFISETNGPEGSSSWPLASALLGNSARQELLMDYEIFKVL